MSRVRRRSLNPAVVILVGGSAVLDAPHIAALTGADAAACDGAEAVVTAQRRVGRAVSEKTLLDRIRREMCMTGFN